jgi:hypothetical protein
MDARVKSILTYSAISLGALAALGITIGAINKRRFSGKSRKVGKDAGAFGKNDAVGKDVRPSGNFVNVRSTPEIPPTDVWTDCEWWDAYCAAKVLLGYNQSINKSNVVAVIQKGDVFGKVHSIVTGKDGWDWYLVKGIVIEKSPLNWSGKVVDGYVREDVVIVEY